MKQSNLTPDQQIKYNLLTKVYMSKSQSLLQAKLELLAKERDDIDAAAEQIRIDWEAGRL